MEHVEGLMLGFPQN